MKLKEYAFPLKRMKWEDIEIGEVFGIGGCINILYKISNRSAMFITDDWRIQFCNNHKMNRININESKDKKMTVFWAEGNSGHVLTEKVYKLPKDIQQLWIPEESL